MSLRRLAGKACVRASARAVTGIEPVRRCRERALFRLRALAPTVALLPPKRWAEVPAGSVDLVTCHEVLHLLEDLPNLFGNIARVFAARVARSSLRGVIRKTLYGRPGAPSCGIRVRRCSIVRRSTFFVLEPARVSTARCGP